MPKQNPLLFPFDSEDTANINPLKRELRKLALENQKSKKLAGDEFITKRAMLFVEHAEAIWLYLSVRRKED